MGRIAQTMTEGVLGVQYYVRNVLYSAGDLTPDRLFIVSPMFSDMLSQRGISFLDENGERRYFAISINEAEQIERPGTFIIFEIDFVEEIL